jgi:hypothetical protein
VIVDEVVQVLYQLPQPMDRLKSTLFGERLWAIAWVVENHRNPTGYAFDEWMDFRSAGLLRGSVDWNVTLEKINATYNELNRIFAISDRKALRDQLRLWSDRLGQDQQHLSNPWVQAIGYINPGKRSRIVADELNSTTIGAYHSLLDAVERVAVERELISVAAEVLLHRLATGSAPERLQDLVPETFAAVPQDGVHGNPLRYRRLQGNDFLLYSLGPNGRDDEGSHRVHSIYRGIRLPGGLGYFYVEDVERTKRFFEQSGETPPADLSDTNSWIAQDADDISWRTPLPPEPLEEMLQRRIAEYTVDENGEMAVE